MDDGLEIINWIQGKEQLPDIVVGQDRVWVGQVVVAEPESPAPFQEVPHNEAATISPPARSLSSYFGVPSQDHATGFEAISSAAPDASASIFSVPTKDENGKLYHI